MERFTFFRPDDAGKVLEINRKEKNLVIAFQLCNICGEGKDDSGTIADKLVEDDKTFGIHLLLIDNSYNYSTECSYKKQL